MKRLKAILSASGLVLLAVSLPSWAQLTRTLPTQTVTLSGPSRPSIIPGAS